MDFFSDTQETTSRFGEAIEDFRDVFRCNGIEFGSREAFLSFARTVRYHSELRNDLARVAKTVIEIEGGVSLRSLLTIIALASGGSDIAECEREMNIPVNLVIEFLVGAGVCSQFHADHLDFPCSGSMASNFGGSNTLAESLSRLEMGSLELKMYLDSIDERINRIEPRLQNLKDNPPAVLSEPPDRLRVEVKEKFSPTISSEIGFQPESYESSHEERTAIGLLAALRRHWTDAGASPSFRRHVALPIFAGVATVLLAGSLLRWFERDISSAALYPLSASAVGGGGDVGSSSPAPQAVSSVSNPSVTPMRRKKPVPSHLRSAPASLHHTADLKASPVAATVGLEDTDSADRAYNLSSIPGPNRLVNVSSGVMEANLVSGPKPSYPMLASLTHLQGNVVMEAVISKDGTVEHVQVIKGHRLLRGAAKNAVRSWLYRPYKVDGVPVEVATTVTVDFDSRR
jgi:TonB family protein